MPASAPADLVAELARARAAACPAAIDPAQLPADPGAAHAAALAALDPARIGGWKIGGANPWSQAVFGNAELFYGPLLDTEIHHATPVCPLAGLVAPLAEPEIMLELGPWPPAPGTPLFTRMALGFEIPATVLPAAAKPHLTAQILDRAGAGGLWIGPAELFDGRRLAGDFAVAFRHNDGPAAAGRAADVFGGPLGSALLFLGQALRRGAPLAPGQWIATGGLVRAVPVAPGDRLAAEAAGMAAAVACA